MAIFSALSGIIGGSMAAKAQTRASEKGIREQRRAREENLRLLSPTYQIGQSAAYTLADLYGLDRPTDYVDVENVIGGSNRSSMFGGFGGVGGYHYDPQTRSFMRDVTPRQGVSMEGLAPADERRAKALEGFYQSPDYTFRLDEGLKALEQSAAARGAMLSGAHLKDLTRFSQGLASSEYGNYVNRLAQLSGYGQQATGTAVNVNTGAAGNIAALQGDIGAARASGYLTGVQGIQKGVQNNMDLGAKLLGGGF